jgi:hypothetical protein
MSNNTNNNNKNNNNPFMPANKKISQKKPKGRNNSTRPPAAAAAQRNNTIYHMDLQRIIELYRANEKRFNEAPRIIPGIRSPSATEIYNYNHSMAEIHLQLYLIYYGYRKMAEVRLELPDAIIRTITEYLERNGINCHTEKGELGKVNVHYLYLCTPGYDCKRKKTARGTDVATELGSFYTCQSDFEEWSKHEWRVVINCDKIELFAQMCTIEQIQANIVTTTQVYEEICGLFLQLDRDRFGGGNDRFGHPKPNPLKIQIYRTKPKE